MPKNPHGIFCLEIIWFDEAWNPSARPLLELLERVPEVPVPLVHRDVSTWEELDFCLGRWVGRNMHKKDYRLGHLGILYLGFHGSPGNIYLRTDSLQKSPTMTTWLSVQLQKASPKTNPYTMLGDA